MDSNGKPPPATHGFFRSLFADGCGLATFGSGRPACLAMVALLVLCFGLAAWLETWFQTWKGSRTGSADILNVLFGDSRRMFSNHFFVKADEYFHSGYYPSIFDKREAFRTPHMAEDTGTVSGHNRGDEEGFLGEPLDWIDAFSRKFFPSRHTHLDERGAQGAAGDLGKSSEVREILPWLRLSAELDPNRVETYTVTAYWLRERMGKIDEAEAFLREGLRANPTSYEIQYELGRVYAENRHDPARARNLWEAALRNWQKQEGPKEKPDRFLLLEIVSHLALLETKQGNLEQGLRYMEMWKEHSPSPDEIQKQIDEIRKRLEARPSGREDGTGPERR
jgi:tetratricopeptide (TPR) repeat protein